jgi:hypothetical protein
MTYRVIQWATGEMGRDMLRQVIDHPDLELVGVKVFSEKKAGLDAGEIAGRSHVGVTATMDTQEILALDADVVLHTPLYMFDRGPNDEDVLSLLRSGKNVISNYLGFFWPPATPGDRAERIVAACLEGGTTVYGAGLQPAVLTSQIIPTYTGLCSDVRSISLSEFWQFTDDPRPEFVFDVCGYGADPESVEESSSRGTSYLEKYTETFSLTAAQIGCEVTGIDKGNEYRVADRDIEIAAGTVRKGTVSCIRWHIELRTTGPTIRFQSVRTADPDPPPPWEFGKYERIEIDGDPPIRSQMEIDHSFAAEYVPLTRAICSPPILAIPEVVAAPPGILRANVFGPWRRRLGPPTDGPWIYRG